MFKKLRIKFIAITMVMVAIVMALAFTIVCITEYQRSYSVVQTALSDAVEQARSDEFMAKFGQNGRQWLEQTEGSSSSGQAGNKGEGNGGNGQGEGEGKGWKLDGSDAAAPPEGLDLPEGVVPPEIEQLNQTQDSSIENAAPPFIGNREGRQRSSSSLIPVAVYRINADGTTNLVPQVTTATLSEDVVSDAIESASATNEGYGTFAQLELHYYKVSDENGAFLVFADTSYTDNWKSLAFMLVLVGLGTLIVFFVITLFYSTWALRPVREAWDSQRQFVADASHDLKTPLTVILANASILLKHPDHNIAQESQWIESTQVEAENMQGLVNEMLELAQIEAGEKIEVEKEEIDFSDIVDGETLLFDSVALERNCAFNCDVAEGISVYANQKQVEKMVATLVENAFKYVNDGGQIDVTLKRSGKMAVLAIRNTGSTISADDLPHIFDRFYRTDKARTSGAGGFGLGLAIAREIALQHGGDITCTSSEGQGTTFTATLPIK